MAKHRSGRIQLFGLLTALVCAALFAWATPLSSQPARGLGVFSPLPAAERLFLADFDDLDAHAEAARGSRTASLTRPLQAAPETGVRRGALSLAAGERCRYQADRNVRPEEGTISFWLRAGGPLASAATPGRFFQLRSAGADPFVLAIDTGSEPDTLRVVVKRGRGPDRVTHLLHAPAVWRERRWQRVDVSWRSDRLALYLDGVLHEFLPMRGFRMPALENAELELLPGAGSAFRGEPPALDELAIWSRALADAEIAQAFDATRKRSLAPPLVVAPRLATPLHVDGQLDAMEWAKAALVPVAVDVATGFAAPRFGAAYLAWDGTALRVGFESPASDEDAEALVLLVWVPGAEGREHRWRVTSDATVYQGPAGRTLGHFARAREGGVWRVEAEIPLDGLAGAAPSPGSELRMKLGREVQGRAVLGGEVGWGGGDGAWGSLRLGNSSEGVRVVAAPALSWGQPAFEVEGAPGWRARLRTEAAGTDAVESTWRLPEPAPAAHTATAEGLVELSVRDEAGDPLLSWSARFAPSGLLEGPLLPDPSGLRLGTGLSSAWFGPHWRELVAAKSLEIEITDIAPDGSRTESRAHVPEGFALQWVPSSYTPGVHRLSYRFFGPDAGLLWAMQRDIDVPKLDWVGRDPGATASVLEPWTPLRYDRATAVEMWGRHYELDGPLLAAVQNQGRPLLRGPMRLELETTAGKAVLTTEASEVVEQEPARGAWRGVGVLGASGVRVEWTAELEYDGLLVSTLAFEPPAGGVEVQRLGLEIPVRSDVVRFIRGTHAGAAIRSGRVPWNGRSWRSGFEPFVWITNEREGFLYFSDSQANWVHPDGARVVSVSGGKDAGIQLDLVQGPFRLDRRVEYRLGFQATPVKPMLPDARAWNFGNFALAPGQNAMNWITGWSLHEGVFAVADPEALGEFASGWRNRGLSLLLYGATSATPGLGAIFRLFEADWRSAYAASFPGETAATQFRGPLPPHRTVGVCPATRSFQDMLLQQAQALVRYPGVAGLYTDTDGVLADDNALHGCGFEDSFGQRGVTFGILAKRRFAKRMAAIVRQAPGGRGYWMSHSHAQLVPPVHGFADFWHPGEELRSQAVRDPFFYVDGLDPTAWRVEYRGESSGVVHIFLPELASPPDPAATQAMLAMAAVNDVNVAAVFSDRSAVGESWGLRKRLGLLDADFVGHWEPGCPVRVAMGNATASAYRTAKGWVLAVANPLARAQTIRLRLDRERIGSAVTQAVDARTGDRLPIREGELEVSLAPRGFTYLPLEAP